MTSDVQEVLSSVPEKGTNAEAYDGFDDFQDKDQPEDYRTLAGLAVTALIVGLISPLALVAPILMSLPVLGTLLAVLAILKVRRESQYYTGFGLAMFGLMVSVVMFISAAALHMVYGYLEVPEGYEEISFRELQPDPEHPEMPIPPSALGLDGKKIFVKGYIYPGMRRTGLTKFILVPDMKTCCFGGQPELTDMIEVRLRDPLSANFAYRRRGLAGTLYVHRDLKPTKELTGVFYELEADHLQ